MAPIARFLIALLLAGMGAVPHASAQLFYGESGTTLQQANRGTLAEQDARNRQRIARARQRFDQLEAERQTSTRFTDRDVAVVQRRYGNAIPNPRSDTQSTTIQSNGNRSILVPQR